MKRFLCGVALGVLVGIATVVVAGPNDDFIIMPTGQRVSAVREQRAGMDQLRVRAECRGMDEALKLLRTLTAP